MALTISFPILVVEVVMMAAIEAGVPHLLCVSWKIFIAYIWAVSVISHFCRERGPVMLAWSLYGVGTRWQMGPWSRPPPAAFPIRSLLRKTGYNEWRFGARAMAEGISITGYHGV